MKSIQRRRRSRALALAGAMGILMMILAVLLLGALATASSRGGLSGTADSALVSARKRTDTQTAQNLADAGARLMVQWLADGGLSVNPSAPAPPSSFGAPFFGATVSGGYDVLTVPQGTGSGTAPGTIKIRLYPYVANAIQNRRGFLVESVGVYQGTTQVIRLTLLEGSFARYAFFSDRTPTNWWVAGNSKFNGPVHINGLDAAGVGVDPAAVMNVLWKWDPAQRIFDYNGPGSFSTSMAASQMRWSYGAAGNYFTPSTAAEWTNIIATAQAPQFGAPVVKMPVATSKQASDALGGTAAPVAVGVTVPSSGSNAVGGVYINGDVDSMKLSTAGTNQTTQVMEVRQTSGATQIRTTVTIDPTSGTTTVRRDTDSGSGWTLGTPTTLTGVTNGVIYASGNVNSLSGTIANNVMSGTQVSVASDFTLATAPTKDVKITGGLVYANLVSDASNPDNPVSNAASATTESGTLGIVSRKIQLAQQDDGGNALTDLSVHATCMAFDTFDAEAPDTRTPGSFKLLGGYIVKNNGTFGKSTGTGNLLSGLRVTRNFDQRNVVNPPPSFPNEENVFHVTSYQRARTTAE